MRRFGWLMFLLIPALLAGCSDATGIGGSRSVEGRWSGIVQQEDIYLTLNEDRGEIWGSGSWGYDAITVTGNRSGSDVSLVFEFSEYQPVNFQGELERDRMEGWITGSGYAGESATLWRE